MTSSSYSRSSPSAAGPQAAGNGQPRGRAAAPVLEAPARDRWPRLTGRPRRRRSRLAAGAVIVLVCLFGFLAAASAVLGKHTQVLALAQAVPAGASLSPADLTVVDMPPVSGVATMPAGEQAQVIGRTTAVPLTAGSLLSAADLGPPAWPPAGKAIVALPLSPGAFPPELQLGARVAVMSGRVAGQAASASGQAPGPATVIIGTVTGITGTAGTGQALTVVSLEVDTAAAPSVEQMSSPVLVLLDPAGTDVP